MTAVMGAAKDTDVTPLLKEMQWRREGAGTPYKVNQSEIARKINASPSYISLLESGKRSLHNVPGHDLYIILRGYHYSHLDIQGIVTTYNLNAPPQLLDSTAESRTVVVVSEGGVSQPREQGEVEVHRSALNGLEPSVVRERTVKPHDLGTAKAQERAVVGSQLIISDAVAPTDDSLVVIEIEGVQALATWPIKADWVTPYGQGGPLGAKPIDASPKLVAVVVSVTMPQPYLAGE